MNKKAIKNLIFLIGHAEISRLKKNSGHVIYPTIIVIEIGRIIASLQIVLVIIVFTGSAIISFHAVFSLPFLPLPIVDNFARHLSS